MGSRNTTSSRQQAALCEQIFKGVMIFFQCGEAFFFFVMQTDAARLT